jgi:NAD(P)-dependent dehydrogenase (short-subunit alcohol dehydrogenase family)
MIGKPSAVVIGTTGGIGKALCEQITAQNTFEKVFCFGRPEFELRDEASIAAAAEEVADFNVTLVINAAGFLHNPIQMPEKNFRDLNVESLSHCFAVNAIGPALIFKHFTPFLPRDSRSVVAHLSARVGSIGDNNLGGWYGYRASKAALNQIIKTASIELKRTHPKAISVALHPGTVETKLSEPFSSNKTNRKSPEEAAKNLLAVIDSLSTDQTGGFFDWSGSSIPW